jgi:glucokinase
MNELSNKSGKLVGVEVSNSTIKAVCVDKKGDLVDSYATNIFRDDEKFPQIVKFINNLKDRFGNFEKIGLAIPGLIDQQTKRVAFSTFIPEHEKIDFLGELESETGLSIVVENDANAAAYAEFLLGAGRGSRNMFYATIGRGVGGALIFDGKIWRGISGFAGEFGHIAIDADGLKLENVASRKSIVQRTRNRFHQDHTSSLSKFEEEEITISDIVSAAEKEDDFAQMMLKRTGYYIGTAIAGVINLLNVEKIVVGGEIMQAKHLVLDAIIERAKELSFAPSFETTQIVEGELGDNSTAIGAAFLSNAE